MLRMLHPMSIILYYLGFFSIYSQTSKIISTKEVKQYTTDYM